MLFVVVIRLQFVDCGCVLCVASCVLDSVFVVFVSLLVGMCCHSSFNVCVP